jgi:hypothetical protein
MINFISDRKVLVGIGIGMIIATVFMLSVKINVNLSQAEIEMRARKYGMEYKGEHKVIEDETINNDKAEDVKK